MGVQGTPVEGSFEIRRQDPHLLTKSMRVLSIRESAVHPDSGLISFVQEDEETGLIFTSLLLDIGSWKEMGEPREVTISVEPDDQLTF